jgi:hypothetical protein
LTRIISFSDGFTSSTAPILAGGSLFEEYTILNATLGGTLFTIDSSLYKTAFVDYELIREDSGNTYIQQGSFILAYDSTTWAIVPGNFTGVDMLRDTTESITNPYEIILDISSLGVLTYDSGNMGVSYVGTLKLNITRVAV